MMKAWNRYKPRRRPPAESEVAKCTIPPADAAATATTTIPQLPGIDPQVPATRKTQPPTYHGKLDENLELWFFALKQYYADYHPIMIEESPQFVTMISCHLGVTPMNWYRQFAAKCDTTNKVKAWSAFKAGMRRRFLPPDSEYQLRERLCALSQTRLLHDNVAEFQNLLIQCTVPISQLQLHFYFQQGLKPETVGHIREHHPNILDETVELALRFDHAGQRVNNDWQATETCHRCKNSGHIALNCPSLKQ